MKEQELRFTLRVYDSVNELTGGDALLLEIAKDALNNSWSPYSKFKVAATVLLANGKTVTGTNQENAAFPAGICAEGTAISAAAALYPGVPLTKIAITVKSGTHVVNHPVATCGICRQQLIELETRYNNNIEIILKGEEGPVYSIASVKDILPLNFSKSDL